METAAKKIARLDRSIARRGETVTFQRTATDASTGAVTVVLELPDCPARVRVRKPQDLLDTDVKEMEVTISSTQILAATIGSPAVAFGVPEKDDKVLIDGDPSNVAEIETHKYGGALVRVNLLCRG